MSSRYNPFRDWLLTALVGAIACILLALALSAWGGGIPQIQGRPTSWMYQKRFASTALANCLVAYYSCDGPNILTGAEDNTGHGFNVVNGNAFGATGQYGIITNGYGFTGGAFSIGRIYNDTKGPCPLGIGYIGPFTVQAWITNYSNASAMQTLGMILGINNASGTDCATDGKQNAWSLLLDASGKMVRWQTVDSCGGTKTDITNLLVNVASAGFHHIVAGYDGVNDFLYVDNQGTNTPVAGLGVVWQGAVNSTVSTPVCIGNFYDNANGINAGIDEVGIWSRALTVVEVAQLYNGGRALRPNLSAITFAGCGQSSTPSGACHTIPGPSFSPSGGTHTLTLSMLNNWPYNSIYFTVDGVTLPDSQSLNMGGVWDGHTLNNKVYSYSGPITVSVAVTNIALGSVGCGCPPRACEEWYDSAYTTNTIN